MTGPPGGWGGPAAQRLASASLTCGATEASAKYTVPPVLVASVYIQGRPW